MFFVIYRPRDKMYFAGIDQTLIGEVYLWTKHKYHAKFYKTIKDAKDEREILCHEKRLVIEGVFNE